MNRKLRLELDALSVESFTTSDGKDAYGTVRANAGANGEPCPRTDESTCDPNQVCGCIPSWAITCAGASSCNVAVAQVEAEARPAADA
ncbi:MAG TPA: pinensin family lanthipeptide [Longimicrobium sp.]|nr:pinensin family lanthipeptide [Longimicrobium sp.]